MLTSRVILFDFCCLDAFRCDLAKVDFRGLISRWVVFTLKLISSVQLDGFISGLF